MKYFACMTLAFGDAYELDAVALVKLDSSRVESLRVVHKLFDTFNQDLRKLAQTLTSVRLQTNDVTWIILNRASRRRDAEFYKMLSEGIEGRDGGYAELDEALYEELLGSHQEGSGLLHVDVGRLTMGEEHLVLNPLGIAYAGMDEDADACFETQVIHWDYLIK